MGYRCGTSQHVAAFIILRLPGTGFAVEMYCNVKNFPFSDAFDGHRSALHPRDGMSGVAFIESAMA